MTQPLRVIAVGAGNRAIIYSSFQDQAPERLQLVGVVDPDARRRDEFTRRFPTATGQWESIDAMPPAGEVADAVINGTTDNLHIPTTIELMDKGYDVLVEKPLGNSAEGLLELLAASERTGRRVFVCHVLRHAPFYRRIKELLVDGAVGQIINVQMAENVSFDHMALSFIRGKYSQSSRHGSGMLLAKCCHDLDLMAWMMSGIEPTRATSVGNQMYFREDKAPEGSGTRCVVDCQIEATCPYSAKRHYVDNGWNTYYPWEHMDPNMTREEKLESLVTDNPFGRCVWRSDSDMVDHQVVSVEFADGATGSMSLVTNSPLQSRTIHIVGTKGELFGELHSGQFTLRRIVESGPERCAEEVFNVDDGADSHGGGDLRLAEDFVNVLTGGPTSVSTTALADSINGHMIGFAAERGRLENRWVSLDEMRS